MQLLKNKPRASLDDLIVTHHGTDMKSGKSFLAMWFMSGILTGIELVDTKRTVYVIVEESTDQFFDEFDPPPPSPATIEDTKKGIVFQTTASPVLLGSLSMTTMSQYHKS